MKRLLVVLLISFAMFGGATAGNAGIGVVQAQQDPAQLTVYITKTGEKYHADRCQHLRRSKIPVSLKEAVTRGYGPCSVCKPPTLARSS